ncbi:uncharacterized protein LOC135138353 isoform X2 [Zophobas morio]|uniref:uncharacterized protein LOC135138353 isoform X2 n=1 Tax=Zophobas morio TaxID=2755281 RepID=UPI00308331C9
MVLRFKLWNLTRTLKLFVAVEETKGNIRDALIAKASEKMKIHGTSLVLESDGTEIEDDDTLMDIKKETLMLLQDNEIWYDGPSVPLEPVHSFASADTLSVSDSSLSSISRASTPDTERLSENPWEEFEIPWSRMSSFVIKDCEAGLRHKSTITEVIHCITNALKGLKNIAKKVVLKYPKTFQDIDEDGHVYGDGSHSIFSKLREHFKYVNRRSSAERSDAPSPISLKKRKKMLASKAGCSNWQPHVEEHPVDVTENIKEQLKTIDIKCVALEPEILDLLEKSYLAQRLFLNSAEPPALKTIRQEWPVLLCPAGIFWHYEKLMSQNINVLYEALITKSEKILKFGRKKNYINDESLTDENDKFIKVMVVLCMFFSEPPNALYCIVNDESDIGKGMNAPSIIGFHKGSTVYHVVMENEVLNGGSCYFKDALLQLFAIYYNFNLEYPKQTSNTLEFIQRYMMKIHPDVGTKNKKTASKMKIISLINKLRDE